MNVETVVYRSLYSYKGSHRRTLSFGAGERFIEAGPSRDNNWRQVFSETGLFGYVPNNYITVDELSQYELSELIDTCMEAAYGNSTKADSGNADLSREALQHLAKLRLGNQLNRSTSSSSRKRQAPPPPQRESGHDYIGNGTPSKESLDSFSLSPNCLSSPQSGDAISPILPVAPETPRAAVTPTNAAPVPQFVVTSNQLTTESGNQIDSRLTNNHHKNSSTSIDVSDYVRENIDMLTKDISKNYVHSLIEEVRGKTNISFSQSQQVVEIVLHSLSTMLPVLCPVFDHIMQATEHSLETDNSCLTETGDGRRLLALLERLRECKDDEQQRSWALHADEHTITSLMNRLLEILFNGDATVCRAVLKLDDFRPLLVLVQYYQMETRWALRRLLLQVFRAVCQLSAENISYLSSCILPVELIRELQECSEESERAECTAHVLVMVLCMGDPLPFTHFAVINEPFIRLLLDAIERHSRRSFTEPLADLFFTLVLAFNLQYSIPLSTLNPSTGAKGGENGTENLLMRVLSEEKRETRNFTEKLLLLFNREKDPLALFDHEFRPRNCVLKIMQDLYATKSTASLFYTNDERVICDIVVRQLTDLAADDEIRIEYLRLLVCMVTHGEWPEHRHRWGELLASCKSFFLPGETIASGEADGRQLVKAVLRKYPDLFH